MNVTDGPDRAGSDQLLTVHPGLAPRERLRAQGAAALSDVELLALVLGSITPAARALELAGRLLGACGGWIGLARTEACELWQHAGIAPARAAAIAAALEIGRRRLLPCGTERLQIRTPSDAAQLMQLEMGHLDQEHLRAICLDTKNRVQTVHTVYVGSVNTALIRVGEVFKAAVKLNSASLIVVHNHPSGDPTPSPEDVLVTRQTIDGRTTPRGCAARVTPALPHIRRNRRLRRHTRWRRSTPCPPARSDRRRALASRTQARRLPTPTAIPCTDALPRAAADHADAVLPDLDPGALIGQCAGRASRHARRPWRKA